MYKRIGYQIARLRNYITWNGDDDDDDDGGGGGDKKSEVDFLLPLEQWGRRPSLLSGILRNSDPT